MPGIATLTTGAIQRIMSGEEVEKPVLQVLRAKKITSNDTERCGILISDGKFTSSYVMLTSQLNLLHLEGKLSEFTIIRVDKYITSVVNETNSGKCVLIILDLKVLNPGIEVEREIGNPVTYTEAAASSCNNHEPTSSHKAEAKPSLCANSSNAVALNQSISAGIKNTFLRQIPYLNMEVIKARVTRKSDIRTWSKVNSVGKFFDMDLMDESGKIRCIAFQENCDKFYEMIEVDRVYFISQYKLNFVDKQFDALNNDLEMIFTNKTVVEPCNEDNTSGPETKFKLTPISQIAKIESQAVIDCPSGSANKIAALEPARVTVNNEEMSNVLVAMKRKCEEPSVKTQENYGNF